MSRRRRSKTEPRVTSLLTHYWSNVDKNGPVIREELGACWIWTGKLWAGEPGITYGLLCIGSRKELVHRFAYEMVHGPLRRLQALHHCDNPPCVNPDHLHAGSPKDNGRDRREHGRKPRAYDVAYKYANEPLAEALIARSMSLRELSIAIGVSHQTLNGIARCDRAPTSKSRDLIAAFLGEELTDKIVRAVPYPSSRKVTDEVQQQIVVLLDAGARQRDVVARFSLSLMTVNRIARETDNPNRVPPVRKKVDPSTRKNKFGLTPEKIVEMRRLFASGVTSAEIGRRFNINQGMAWSVVHRRAYAWVVESSNAEAA